MRLIAKAQQQLMLNPLLSNERLRTKLELNSTELQQLINEMRQLNLVNKTGLIKKFDKSITVVGGSNVDYVGKSFVPIKYEESNPGKVEMSYGGVGRNISENLARLGQKVKLITKLGDDSLGKMIYHDLEKLNVIIDENAFIKGEQTSIYLSVLDDQDDLLIAISSMEILDTFDLSCYWDDLENSDVVIIDGNLPEKTIKELFEKLSSDIYVETVSFQKAKKFINYLNQISFMKPNKNELGALLGRKIRSKQDIEEGALELIRLGVKEVLVTSGSLGSFYTTGDISFWIHLVKPEVVQINGAGDTLYAGFVLAKTMTDDIISQLKFAGMTALAHLENRQLHNDELGIDDEMSCCLERVLIKK